MQERETAFNVRLNNHRNDVRNPHPNTILACKHFPEKNHNFNKHAKFIIIEELTNTQKKPKPTLNSKTKPLDPNIRQHVPKRVEPTTQ